MPKSSRNRGRSGSDAGGNKNGAQQTLVTLENFESLGSNCVINSPRSLEAVLRLGYDTAELAPRSPESFRNRMEIPEVSRVRFEHFDQQRTRKVDESKGERRKIIKAMARAAKAQEAEQQARLAASASSGDKQADEWAAMREAQDAAAAAKRGSISKSASAPELISIGISDQDAELARRTEKMLEQERARLRKAKARQAAEVESILQHEKYLVKMHHRAAILAEKEAERMAALKAKREAKMQAAVEKREARRQQLYEMQQIEEEKMKAIAIRDFKEQKKLAEMKKAKEVQNRIEAQKRQAERLRKAAIRREKTQKILLDLERQGDERLKKLVHADQVRVKKSEEADAKRREEAKLRRDKSIKRIQMARAQADANLEAKKRAVFLKHEKEEARHAERRAKEEAAAAKKIEDRQAKDAIRMERLESMREEQVMKVS